MLSPREYFGNAFGSEGIAIRWDRILEYYKHLASESDRMKIQPMGSSGEGAPFVSLCISAPENLTQMETFRKISKRLADPRSASDEEIDRLCETGKAVVLTVAGSHPHEPASVQMAPELVYSLLSGNDAATLRILEETIFLLIPCAMPDGQMRAVDWNEQTRKGPHPGFQCPEAYNRFMAWLVSRDALTEFVPESGYINRLMIYEWNANAYLDHHQGNYFIHRTYIPSVSDAVDPNLSPLAIREQELYVMAMLTNMEENGETDAGPETGWPIMGYDGFWTMSLYRNIPGILTETADARFAMNATMHPEQYARDEMANGRYPSAWKGGEWTLLDIMRRQKHMTLALLSAVAARREQVLRNTVLKARAQIEKGAKDTVGAYLIPVSQHDRSAARHLVDKLCQQQIEVRVAEEPVILKDGCQYPEGTWIVPLAQPYYALVKAMLASENYPDNRHTRRADGRWICPMDIACLSYAETMGVCVVPANGQLSVKAKPYHTEPLPVPEFPLSANENESYRTANRRLISGGPVWRAKNGDFLAQPRADAYAIRRTRVGFMRLSRFMSDMQANNSAAYMNYEILKDYGFDCSVITDHAVRAGEVSRYEALILPGDEPERLRAGDEPLPQYPPQYDSGLGTEGKRNIVDFVRRGGLLIAWGASCDYVIDALGLAIHNPIAALPQSEFTTLHSSLHVELAKSEITIGMPEQAKILWDHGAVFEVLEHPRACDYESIARYPGKNVLSCGLMTGEKYIANRCCVMRVKYGAGAVLLYGFDPFFRAKAHGSYKLLFNALYQAEGKNGA